ncbi:LRRNT_2 domain-containing protein, partial [Cephalotus follicularis]
IWIRGNLDDPHGVLDNWDSNVVDPCSWTMVTCSVDSLVIGLRLNNNSLTGTIPSPLANMTKLVKKIHQEKKLDMLVDKDLKNNYDRIELEEMVQVPLLCTQNLPSHRPKMSEVVWMLEGDGLAEKWEATQRAEAIRYRANEFSSSERYSDLTDDSSLLVQAMELSGPR